MTLMRKTTLNRGLDMQAFNHVGTYYECQYFLTLLQNLKFLIIMNDLEKENVCEAAKFALNGFWKDKAHVEIINPKLFWFSLWYNKDFDAMNELKQLGIDYDSRPKNWIIGEYSQTFFLTSEVWEKIRSRYQSEKK